MVSNTQFFKARRILVDEQWQDNMVIGVEKDGMISYIDSVDNCEYPCTDLGDCSLLPGMIDSHVHGAIGHDVMDATHESLDQMSQYFAQNGVTGFVATTVTAPVQKIKHALMQIGKSREIGVSGAQLLGAYLEGPYFTATHKGAHPPHWFRELDTEELDKWISYSDDSLITVALAPEKSNSSAAIRHLKKNGIKVMLGHSDASFDQVIEAFNNGADGIVHCYNGMRGLHHRDPGVVGAGLCHPDSYVEIIADGHHVHPTAIDVAHRCCGDKLTLITDAMQAAGMPDGKYQLGEFEVEMSQGVVKTESGSLAGSTLSMIEAVNNVADWLNIPFEQSWLLASLTPAKSLKIDDKYGSLSVGKMASMVAISKTNQILATWVNGKQVFSKIREAVCI